MAYTIASLEAELPTPEMNELATEILASSLHSLGLFRNGVQTLAALPSYLERWLSSSVSYLQQQGCVAADGTLLREPRALSALWSVWEAKAAEWCSDPARQAQSDLLRVCLEALPAILTGKERASDVVAIADGFGRGHDLLGATLTACLDRLVQSDPERRVRLIEIGAGRSGATGALLPMLGQYAVDEYCCSDVSQSVLAHAASFKADFPALTTATFDVSEPLESQPVTANHYDFAIAANVLSATRNVREALRNAKAVLKNQGVLLLDEPAGWSLFDHLTFGLSEAWWSYEDAAMRVPGSPAVSPGKWRELLAEEGFESVLFVGEEAHRFGRQIIAAVSNGWTRQRIARKKVVAAAAAPKAEAAVAPRVTERPAPAVLSEQAIADHTRRTITAKLAEGLRTDAGSIPEDASFADYGVDSIIGVKLVRTISEALQIELEPTSLFEYSTVEDLAGFILSKWRTQIAAQMPQVQSVAPAQPSPVEIPVAEVRPATSAAIVASRFTQRGESDARGIAAEPIAVIGMSGRFAESDNLEIFWQNLAAGRELIQPVTRWSREACTMNAAAHGYCSHGSFVDSIDRFDAGFFGIPALEATYMDPQQRLFLEESWSALEDAGYAGKGVQEKQCGVYVGCGSSSYDKLAAGETPAHAFWGNSQSVTPARIAYCLNLQGPAIAVDTACSSSLVAIHLACQGLWTRETDMAVAGGVFLQPTPGFYQVANRAGMLSADGRNYSFDARANGFVPGEGVGVVVLKRLSDAIADGDHVHGVIAGSGINQDGKSNGLTAPNGRAQERLERAVYERFDIDPESIQVVEAHGTATLLGDSVELGALSRAFRERTDRRQFCALGTVKTNIGHLSTAAGVAGVLKLLLSLKYRQIPPSLHFEKSNPAIDLASSPFYVNTRLQPWNAGNGEPRRAVVSSFGFSGTNAHLVLEEAPAAEGASAAMPAYFVVLSARSAEQVRQQVRALVEHLVRNPGLPMTDLAFSLFAGRMHQTHRLACLARDQNELVRLLGQWLERGEAAQVHTAEIQDGKIREQVSLKKFGNYCIQECREGMDAEGYLENLSAIAELYVQGYALDFGALFPRNARRIPLPTYPFARERYWIDDARPAAPRIASAPVMTAQTTQLPAATPSFGSAFQANGVDLRASLQDDLCTMVKQFLNLDSVAPDKVLIDLGFDSIGLTSFATAINERYRLDLTPVLFFDYPSVSEIARYLAEERGSEIAAMVVQPAAAPQIPSAPAQPAAVTVAETRPFSPEMRFVNEPIAIVGIAGVMPQSEDLDALWANLKAGKDLVSEIPEDRWDWREYYGDPLRETNKSNSKWGGFMKEIDKFDPLFFGISPREAQMMDPQQRIFLETVWKAVEDSGHKVSDLAGTRTGVFVGVGSNDYLDIMRSQPMTLDGYTASGNSHSVLANRVSYLLNLRGPSAPVDTACSSSLVALHRAIESIHTRSCDMAIVGGVQVIMSPGGYISFGMAGMLSGDGKCKTFDKRANGYVRGEGCGAMLLKRLSDAEADGDPIYAVIKATSENHGGRVTTMVAPNSAAQASLLIEAYEKAHVDPSTVGYIECHGTGTALGDPIEIQALSKAFSELYQRNGRAPAAAPHCGLGTIKTNIGHLETAAGIAGVLKVVLALRHKELPAIAHFEELNPYIKLDGTPFFIVQKLTPWNAMRSADGTMLPRRAGVSSFGFGGANAHAVLEEYVPAQRALTPSREPRLIVLSARSEERLLAYAQSLRTWLDSHDVELTDLAYTLQIGRDEMQSRLALVVASTDELKTKLDAIAAGRQPQGCHRGEANGAACAVVDRNDLPRIAEAWVSGAKIDWRSLYRSGEARRIAAPTYPFARERHWLPGVAAKKAAAPREEVKETLQTFAPTWSTARIERVAEPGNVLLLGGDAGRVEWVRGSFPQAEAAELGEVGSRRFEQLVWIAPDSDGQEDGVLALFRTIKTLLGAGYASEKLQWTVITSRTQQVIENEPVQPAHAAVAGLIGSVAKEYPHWSLRLLDVDALASVTARECLTLPWDKQGNGLAHRNGEWLQQTLAPAAVVPQAQSAYRKDGVYVVVGGAGGIGEVWSRFMIEQHQANVVWIGRRPVDATIQAGIDRLAAAGRAPLYISADATNAEALAQARELILETYPAIHGVVHSALVLNDQSVARMDEGTFRASLAAKVDITRNLDRVFGNDALDFMLFFSSIVSFVRSAGQSNYAAGCTFKDSFAQSLQQRPYAVKTMNWGYWGSVGAVAGETHRQNMARLGLGSIEPEEGMAALEALMSSATRQIALIKTVTKAPAAAVAKPVQPAAIKAGQTATEHVRQIIVERLCEELRLEAPAIRFEAQMSDYGVDSIVGVNLVRGIAEALQIPLEPSSLFDHGTVQQLTGYIVATWPRQCGVEAAVAVESPRLERARAAEPGETLIDELLWQDASLEDSYEKVTF